MSDEFELVSAPDKLAVSVKLKGYATENQFEAVQTNLLPFLQEGKNRILLDFSDCTLINSPGLSALIELILTVKEDYFGRLMVSGLPPLFEDVFSIAGLLDMVERSATLDTGLQELSM